MAQSEAHTKKCMTHVLKDREAVRGNGKKARSGTQGQSAILPCAGTTSAESLKKTDLRRLDALRNDCDWLRFNSWDVS